jgi:hypothetical protein
MRHDTSTPPSSLWAVADDHGARLRPRMHLPPQVAALTFEAAGGAKGLAGAMGDLGLREDGEGGEGSGEADLLELMDGALGGR